MSLEIGAPVWLYCGGCAPREATITEVLQDGGRIWGYRVLPDSRCKSDSERGEAVSESSLYLRPQHRGSLIQRLHDDAWSLTDFAERLEAAA